MQKLKIALIVTIVAVLAAGLLLVRSRNSGNDGILAASGTVEVTEVDLGFKIAGRIAQLVFQEGETVDRGDRLARLDSAELKSLVEQTAAAVRNAEAELERATKDFNRAEQLSREGVFSAQQLDGATRNRMVAQSQLDQALAAQQAARIRLADTALVAPLSGVVLERNAEPGETVAAGRPIYTLGDLSSPWIKVYVRESKLGLVKLGQRAEVMVDTFPGKVYPGKVTQIASEAEFTPKTVQTREERVKLVFGVKIAVQNDRDELKPGMPADVMIYVR